MGDDVQLAAVPLRNNEVLASTYYAVCRECRWQTAPSDEYEAPVVCARRHNENTGHVTEYHAVLAIIIT